MSQPTNSPLTRRQLLRLGTTGAIGIGAAALPLNALASTKQTPRNIIFMVADGMSLGVPSLAEHFSHMLRQKGTYWHQLAKDPQTTLGYFDMASLNSFVTDSAAASSSWGSGSRINNGAINTLPDGTKLKPIGIVAKECGYQVGLVTTTRMTHATPAGFLSSVPQRHMEDSIALQYLGKADLLLGGGLRHFAPEFRSDKLDVLEKYRKEGYAVIQTRNELIKHKHTGPILGLFSKSHLPYTLDQVHSEDLQKTVPTLADMTQTALKHLSTKPFFMQIEGGRVDHAAHINDAGSILRDQVAFDDAIEEVLNFTSKRDDTLVIITTDHGNANPGLNYYGPKTNTRFERTLSISTSFETLHKQLKSNFKKEGKLTPDTIIEKIRTGTSVELTSKEAQTLEKTFHMRPKPLALDWNQQHHGFNGLLGQMLGNHIGIQWTGITHTADLAPLMAIGPSQERFSGLHKNTEAFTILSQLMGSSYVNPSDKADTNHTL